MDLEQTYRLRIILGEVNGKSIEACIIGRSWDDREMACEFARHYLSDQNVTLVTSKTEEILPTEW